MPWQKNISEGNLERLRRLVEGDDRDLAAEAATCLALAAVAPRRKGRRRRLLAAGPELVDMVLRLGWILEYE